MKPINLFKKSLKKIGLLFSVIALLVLIAAITIAVLCFIKPAKKSQTSGVASSSIISAYIQPDTISGLSSNLYRQQSNVAATIQYQLGSKGYGTSIETKDSFIFYALDKTQKNDTATIQTQTLAFMKQRNLAKTSSSSTAGDTMMTTTYSNGDNVCQLVDFSPSTISGISPYHEISCADNKAVLNEYTAIENLLNIYKKSQKITDLTKAIRFTATDKNVSYSIIYLTTRTSQSSLLFAAVNNNWEYIGDLTAGDIKYASGKYIITPEIKTKINNSKYNGFITKNIN